MPAASQDLAFIKRAPSMSQSISSSVHGQFSLCTWHCTAQTYTQTHTIILHANLTHKLEYKHLTMYISAMPPTTTPTLPLDSSFLKFALVAGREPIQVMKWRQKGLRMEQHGVAWRCMEVHAWMRCMEWHAHAWQPCAATGHQPCTWQRVHGDTHGVRYMVHLYSTAPCALHCTLLPLYCHLYCRVAVYYDHAASHMWNTLVAATLYTGASGKKVWHMVPAVMGPMGNCEGEGDREAQTVACEHAPFRLMSNCSLSACLIAPTPSWGQDAPMGASCSA